MIKSNSVDGFTKGSAQSEFDSGPLLYIAVTCNLPVRQFHIVQIFVLILEGLLYISFARLQTLFTIKQFISNNVLIINF